MHVISRKRLNEFAEMPSGRQSSLAHWFRLMERGDFLELRRVASSVPSADQVGKLTVFNIGGNKVRLIAAIHYNRQQVYIRSVLTHAEYDEYSWKE